MSATEPRWAPHSPRYAPFGYASPSKYPSSLRIGVDEAADRAVFGGDLRLDAAPGAAIAGDDDPPLDVDAVPRELLVVVRNAVVDVDELAGHVAGRRVRVVGRQLLGGLRRGRVVGERRFGQLRRVFRGRRQLEHAHARRREEDVEPFDACVVSPRFEQVRKVVRVGLVVRRADVMRPGCEVLEPSLHVCRLDGRVEARLEVALGCTSLDVEAKHSLRRLRAPAHLPRAEHHRHHDPPRTPHSSS